jgi:uncharacterized protein DUF1801
MAEAKTKPTKQSVKDFVSEIADAQTRADCSTIAKLMEEAAGGKGTMWGTSIAGFGLRTVKYAGGKEADWPLIAFSPRKQNLTLYLSLGDDSQQKLLAKLGKHTMGKGCLYIKRLADVDQTVLKKLIQNSAKKK